MADRDPQEPKAPGQPQRSGIQSLDMALPLLRLLAASAGPRTLTDLAQDAGMPPSKAHRYLVSFSRIGLVLQDRQSKLYDLGPLAAEIGLAALSRNEFVNRAADGLAELTAETGLTSLLSVWCEHGPTIVRWQRAPNFAATSFGLGSTLPLLGSATGHLFLAFLPREITARCLSIEAKARDEGKTPNLEAVQSLVDKVRKDPIASVDGRFIPGLRAIAAPILNWQGEIEAAVTLIGTDDGLLDKNSQKRACLLAFAQRLSLPPKFPN